MVADFRVETSRLSLVGNLAFSYPCNFGHTVSGGATVSLRVGDLVIDNLEASLDYHCEAQHQGGGALLMRVGVAVEKLEIPDKFSIQHVCGVVNMYTDANGKKGFKHMTAAGFLEGRVKLGKASSLLGRHPHLAPSPPSLGAVLPVVGSAAASAAVADAGKPKWGVAARGTFVFDTRTSPVTFDLVEQCKLTSP